MASTLTAQSVYDMFSNLSIVMDCSPGENPETKFLSILNQVIERYNKEGRWRGLTAEIELTVTSDAVVLPGQYSSIIAAREKECNTYVPVFGIEQEYKPTGNGGETCYQTLIDQGQVLNGTVLDRNYLATGFNDNDVIKVLARVAYTPLTALTEYVNPDNIGALKFGFYAIEFEEQLDITRAEQYWAKGMELLDKELNQHLDGEHRTLPIQPNGLQIQPVQNLYY